MYSRSVSNRSADRATPSAFAGAVFTYVLTVRNLGPSTAVDVRIVDSLPAGVEVADFTALLREADFHEPPWFVAGAVAQSADQGAGAVG